MSTLQHSLHNVYKASVETLMSVPSSSTYATTGKLTPSEFTLAGDYLTQVAPTWCWSGGDPSLSKSFLPSEKQMLVTRGVPCLRRARDLEAAAAIPEKVLESMLGKSGSASGGGDENDDDDDGFLEVADAVAAATGVPSTSAGGSGGGASAANDNDAIPDLPDDEEEKKAGAVADDDDDDDDDDIPDMDDFDASADLAVLPPPPPTSSKSENSSGFVATRTYDIYVTYDKFYQTPRIWLFGYDEQRQPLPTAALLEDVSAEHSLKTCTVESHPHLKCHATSIHPCRHADVMKRLTHQLGDASLDDSEQEQAASEPTTPVEHYMILFLKFAQTVLPTLEYDFTRSA